MPRLRNRRALLLAITALAGLPVGAALGYWNGGPGEPQPGTGAAAAASIDQGSTPTVGNQGTSGVLVSWSEGTMSNGGPVDGYLVKRYDAGTGELQTILSGCSGTITATDCTELDVPPGDWEYTVTPTVGNNWRGAESAVSTAVETRPPTQSLALSDPTNAFLSGTTLYFGGTEAGSFTLVDTVADAGSGPASATFPAIATSGWSHDAETVSTPAGGPYASTTFSWIPSPGTPSGYEVSAADNDGNTSAAPISFVNDSAEPTGGGIDYDDGVFTSLSVPIGITASTDSQSGVDESSGLVNRAEAVLDATGTCETFGGFTTTVTLIDGADTSVTSGHCYMYEYRISDNVGNQATYSSTSVAKVDTTGPLGSASAFAVLAGTTVTSTGATVLNGDLGISPGTACTGFPAPCTAGLGTVNGTTHSNDAVAAQAQADVTEAYDTAAAQPVTETIAPELGGELVTPGVYDSTSGTFSIGGTLTLDGQDDPDAVFIFEATTTLGTTATVSQVDLINGAQSCNVFWLVGSSATLAADTLLRGNILAFTSISAGARTVVEGRLLARGGAVTLDTNTVTTATCN